MKTCVYCDKQLPESAQKGGRQKEYCNDACKNKQYRMRKQMRVDTERVSDTYWQAAYKKLVIDYQILEERLKNYEKDYSEMHEYVKSGKRLMKHEIKAREEMQADCVERMKAAGMSEKDVQEFNDYWKRVTRIGYYYDLD